MFVLGPVIVLSAIGFFCWLLFTLAVFCRESPKAEINNDAIKFLLSALQTNAHRPEVAKNLLC